MIEINGIKLEKMKPDDRRFCEQCAYYKSYDWKGLCNAKKVMVNNLLNRCDTFSEKAVKFIKQENFITDDFWK